MPPPSRPVPGFGEMQESINFVELFPVDEMIAKIKNLEPVLKTIGKEMEIESHRAFLNTEQKFGSFDWPPRYGGIPFPAKINYAGALQDLTDGPKVQKRRFNDRPALKDSGLLSKSIQHEVLDNSRVRVGVTGPAAKYAGNQQWGLESTQDIPDSAIDKLDKQIDKETNEERLDGLHALRARLERDGSVLTTKVQQRPFLGVTDEMQVEIPRILSKYFDGGADGRPNT
jgi:phage gpG-like protein